jgi:mannose-6-phosphate isomerase-like protein (cupin superfamily)
VLDRQWHIVQTLGRSSFCPTGYARDVPFGCVEEGLLSILYFLPGQAMAPHRHMDADEYFTVIKGESEMVVNGDRVCLPEGHTFLRQRRMLHAIRNSSEEPLVVQSFQSPIPQDEATVWERVPWWASADAGMCCPRCWCGQREGEVCVNCGARWRGNSC